MGYNASQIDPDWYDVMRPTKLPSYAEPSIGEDGNIFAGVRQSRLGVQGLHADGPGRAQDDLRVRDVRHRRRRGPDDLPPAPRLRRAGASSAPARPGARSWTPTSSPTRSSTGARRHGLLPQRPGPLDAMQGDSHFTVALERPGASGDGGIYADRIELEGVKGRFPLPDLIGAVPLRRGAGATSRRPASSADQVGRHDRRPVRPVGQRHGLGPQPQLEPEVRRRATCARLQFVYGEGIQNYMNDAPVDIGIVNNRRTRRRRSWARRSPSLGIVAFLDHNWNERWTQHRRLLAHRHRQHRRQRPTPTRTASTRSRTCCTTPVPNVMMGGELQWGKRENSGRLHLGRRHASSSRSSTTSRTSSGGK